MALKIDSLGKKSKKAPPKKKPAPPKKARVATLAKRSTAASRADDDHAKTAGAHQRRVTLNLIRHSACADKRLVAVLDKLAAVDWDLQALPKSDQQIVFGQVTEDLANRARDEFQADLETIRDLARKPRAENPDEICELCGHPHIRWEFDLINTAGGRSTKTGSTCIETYGLNVDGYGTQEAALNALKAAVARAKRQADMEEWQEVHPDHEADMRELETMIKWLTRNRVLRPYTLNAHVKGGWDKRSKILLSHGKAALKYYRREHFLTPTRTEQVYGTETSTGVLAAVRAMQAEMREAATALQAAREHWEEIKRAHYNDMSWQERKAIDYLIATGTSPEDTRGHYITLIQKYM